VMAASFGSRRPRRQREVLAVSGGLSDTGTQRLANGGPERPANFGSLVARGLRFSYLKMGPGLANHSGATTSLGLKIGPSVAQGLI
jgi:hypothetical protein